MEGILVHSGATMKGILVHSGYIMRLQITKYRKLSYAVYDKPYYRVFLYFFIYCS